MSLNNLIRRVFDDNSYAKELSELSFFYRDINKISVLSDKEKQDIKNDIKSAFKKRVKISDLDIIGKLSEGTYLAVTYPLLFSLNDDRYDLGYIEIYFDNKKKIINIMKLSNGETLQGYIYDKE